MDEEEFLNICCVSLILDRRNNLNEFGIFTDIIFKMDKSDNLIDYENYEFKSYSNKNSIINDTNDDFILDEKELKFLFYNNDNNIITIGPKIIFNSPGNLNYTVDSLENDLYLETMENNLKNEENFNSLEDEFEEEEIFSSSNGNIKSNNEDNLQNERNSHFSIKIDNSRNQYRTPQLNTEKKIIVTQSSQNNLDLINNTSNVTEGNFFKCCSHKKQNKRKQKNGTTITSFYSTVNNNITHTKKSTNLSIKSLKLNDSLNKLRKKKGTFESNKSFAQVNTGITQNSLNKNTKKEKINCRCLVF